MRVEVYLMGKVLRADAVGFRHGRPVLENRTPEVATDIARTGRDRRSACSLIDLIRDAEAEVVRVGVVDALSGPGTPPMFPGAGTK